MTRSVDGNMHRLAGVAAMALLVAGCTSPGPDGGILGRATMGPVCPVEREPPDPQCADQPYEGRLVVVSADDGRVVKEFSTNATGDFRVAVAVGRYAIRSPEPSDSPPRCANDGVIVVVRGVYSEAAVRCDTGIR